MKVLLMNGSTTKDGCVFRALTEVASALAQDGIETEILQMGAIPVWDCMGCGFCHNGGRDRCIYEDDVVNEWLDKVEGADGFIFGSPVYFSHPTGQFQAVLDRMFYAGGEYFQHKPAAAIVTARRAGTTVSIDALNKYFTNACMPVVTSTYWNMVHGNTPEQIEQDTEGLQTMRNLGHNMAWMLKCLEAGKKEGVLPPKMETQHRTNFIQ
ncbi:MAG: flavodoxin family protein [Eubacteriales bacterium]|nr:flavodoxin family protein [Eubacteriales bacterium]